MQAMSKPQKIALYIKFNQLESLPKLILFGYF
ncbi:hypothetical protein DJ56_4148 [Yersinia pestis]|nr:hypothetical protein DJ56_4148 [Yersinia pestis]KGA68138.1 hypothetical protein DJ55_4185 [Yersinia pseudotuberculosis]